MARWWLASLAILTVVLAQSNSPEVVVLADGVVQNVTLTAQMTLAFQVPQLSPVPVPLTTSTSTSASGNASVVYLSVAICYSLRPDLPGYLPVVSWPSGSATTTTTTAPIPLDGLLNLVIPSAGTLDFTISPPAQSTITSMTWTLKVGVSRRAAVLQTATATDGTGLLYDDTDATSVLLRSLGNGTSDMDLLLVPSAEVGAAVYPASYCSIAQKARMASALPGTISTTTRGYRAWPRRQFWVQGLTAGTNYTLWLVTGSASSPTLYRPLQIRTKTTTNCKIVTGLTACPNVGYAVPSNATSSASSLEAFYDGAALAKFNDFNTTLAQYPCTDPRAVYSYLRNCQDCADAYRNWLCATLIPRCTDVDDDSFVPQAVRQLPRPGQALRRLGNASAVAAGADPNADANAGAGQMAFIGASAWSTGLPSRFAAIDQTIVPGPYAEVLPCIDLCHEMVRSCPVTVFGFQCPIENTDLLNYGTMVRVDNASIAAQSGGFLTDSTILAVSPSAAYCNPVTTDELVYLQPGLAMTSSAGTRRWWQQRRWPSNSLVLLAAVHLTAMYL